MSALKPENAAFCSSLAAFCDRNQISRRRLGSLLNSSGPTAHRLLTGMLADNIVERFRKQVGPLLVEVLRDRGFSHSEISDELEHIHELEDFVMIADRCPLTPEAARFFGLRHDPFDVDRLPVGDELFTNAELDTVAARVRDAALYQRFVAVIGGVGSGKTLLKLRVAEEVDQKARLLFPEFFDMSAVTVHGIANTILAELGQKIPTNKEARVAKLKVVLTSMQQEGTPVAIVLDECHRLHDKVISSLKNFWEMTNGRNSRLLGVLLFGQPAFVESRLREQLFKEIRQRVQVIEMPSLTKAARSYLEHRITFAGGDFEKLFEKAAVDRIAANATTPLALGNLANEALMDAFAQEEKRVTVSLPSFKRLSTGAQVLGMRRSAA